MAGEGKRDAAVQRKTQIHERKERRTKKEKVSATIIWIILSL